ncbi:protein sidekick-1-like isoform X2 [Copidosoma floridanum]|uniref:protein sidekick-1-like isoform X2 n=1 Tax=Copidosoma floridanum TaxID=29053 RepID=UPI0006C97DAA|nr:protein sidekick-1-like isoform X2 [Copidosoma floridanum]
MRTKSVGLCSESRQGTARLTAATLLLIAIYLMTMTTIFYRSSDAAPVLQTTESHDSMEQPDNPEPSDESPVFEQTASNVSAFEGQTVYLPCRVSGLADKVVSWMRSRDLHILTSGEYTFSSDDRFKLQHLPGSDAWTLQLDRVKKPDAGRYECQVNTEPKIMYAVQLTVRDPNKPEGYDEPHSQQIHLSYETTAPVAAIMGPREQTVAPGSTITLRCVINSPYQTRPIRGVQWLRDNKLLTFQAARGGINVETVTGMAQTFSEATLANVTGHDSGKYSCRPSEGKSDTIFVNVQDSTTSSLGIEAMQHDAPYTSLAVALRPCLASLHVIFNFLFINYRGNKF